uniref:Uncharacterized protein n=1 Tax=uncultured marine virus TaxID=186617 RepID=A0A0F7L7Y3_9VIRU|nr:hypothetical protein [uncultured marine virus]
MIEISLNKKSKLFSKHKIASNWYDFTIDQAIQVQETEMPEKIKQMYELFVNIQDEKVRQVAFDKLMDSVTRVEEIKTFPNYYGKIIQILSTISKKDIENVNIESRNKIYLGSDSYKGIERFVQGIFYKQFNDYNPKEIKHFRFKGTKYYMPKSMLVGSEEILLGNEESISCTEQQDIQLFWEQYTGVGIEQSAMMVAIYCRPRVWSWEKFKRIREPYDERAIIERAKVFKDLPFNLVLEVFFCTEKLLSNYKSSLLSSFLKKVKEIRKVSRQK